MNFERVAYCTQSKMYGGLCEIMVAKSRCPIPNHRFQDLGYFVVASGLPGLGTRWFVPALRITIFSETVEFYHAYNALICLSTLYREVEDCEVNSFLVISKYAHCAQTGQPWRYWNDHWVWCVLQLTIFPCHFPMSMFSLLSESDQPISYIFKQCYFSACFLPVFLFRSTPTLARY